MIRRMTLPEALQDGIDELVQRVDRRALERAAGAISDRYRAGGTAASRAASTDAEIAAYLATRAPATYAAVEDVCRRVRTARPEWSPRSLLDLGAGPGLAAWAVTECWPSVERVTLVEAEPSMLAAGRALAERGGTALRGARWLPGDAGDTHAEADLVVASYVLGEIEPARLAGAVERAWASALDTLVLVEPGTTAGYERILLARSSVLEAGGTVLAPCPHDGPCPLPAGDWCHFSVRLPRSRLHRAAKGAEVGFEDEKLSYVVLCRSPHPNADARVLRRPSVHRGHVVLDLCTTDGLERRTVSKRDGAVYKQARKLGWGDSL
jgi:ribosomal protein RSM22 (predicted rRNA methylase)